MAKIFRIILLLFIITSSSNLEAVSRDDEFMLTPMSPYLTQKQCKMTLALEKVKSRKEGEPDQTRGEFSLCVDRSFGLDFLDTFLSRKKYRSICAEANNDTTCTTKLNKTYFKSYLLDTRDLFIFPKYMHKKDWVKASIIVGVSSATFLIDKNMAIESQKLRTDFTNSIAKYGLEPWGSGLYSLPTLVFFGIHGAFTHNAHSTNIALLGTKSFIITTAAAQTIKYVVQRYRPYASVDHYPFYAQGPFGNWKNDGFPSGHTAAAFAVATAIATEYKHKPWIGILCYTIAAGTGFSRINDNKHWTSDVFFGAALGYGITKLIFTNKNHCKQKVIK